MAVFQQSKALLYAPAADVGHCCLSKEWLIKRVEVGWSDEDVKKEPLKKNVLSFVSQRIWDWIFWKVFANMLIVTLVLS